MFYGSWSLSCHSFSRCLSRWARYVFVTLTPRWTSLTVIFVFSLKVAFRICARLFFAMICAIFFGLFVVCLVYFCEVVLVTDDPRGEVATCCATLVVKSQGRFCVSSSKTAIAVSSRATLAVKSEGRASLYGVICTFMCLKCRTIVSEGCPMCPKC